MKMKRHFVFLFGLALITAMVQAAPTIYGFGAITSNSTIDPLIGQNQLSLSVDSYGTNQVLFNFSNSGPLACSITDIYIEDGILGLTGILNGTGVSFVESASKNNINFPAGNPIGFDPDKQLSAYSEAPTRPNGVNPGEQVGLVFNLLGGNTYDEIINRLNQGIGRTSNVAGDIRVGIHVQGFADGRSESFVLSDPKNPTPPDVPAPSALMLAGIGLSSLWKMRKQLR
jgi:hypothetical protein